MKCTPEGNAGFHNLPDQAQNLATRCQGNAQQQRVRRACASSLSRQKLS